MKNSDVLLRHLRDGVTYYPLDSAEEWNALQAEVISLRQSVLADITLRSESAIGGTAHEFSLETREFLAADTETRRRLMAHPAMGIWLRQAARTPGSELGQPDSLRRLRDEFVAVRDRCLSGAADDCATVAGSIQVRRYDVDPLIAHIAPPTFDFSARQEKNGNGQRAAASAAYPLDFFTQVAAIAMERIATTWPELHTMMPQFVHTLVHVPDGTFRSASAARYNGVVFLAADDDNLLAMEESLVHEFGHQVLYWVMELDPLFSNEGDTDFELPWSGAERDFYGFYHAFYIYILLAHYYRRVYETRPEHHGEAMSRYREITTGLTAAIPRIRAAGDFTPRGQLFTDNICAAARLAISD
ncbi:HEXXH motif-containing putative peptide modification protein [Streptomyces narbonensis]|uniref:HEXXH motif-containing putative peptide modification protein n=1 Tax=Streptomyces narbonensis TaxID=67333 RepID=A0ABV3C6I3_9ACTN